MEEYAKPRTRRLSLYIIIIKKKYATRQDISGQVERSDNWKGAFDFKNIFFM